MSEHETLRTPTGTLRISPLLPAARAEGFISDAKTAVVSIYFTQQALDPSSLSDAEDREEAVARVWMDPRTFTNFVNSLTLIAQQL